jgi:hypothetical protein
MTFSNSVSESVRRLLMFALMASLLLTAGCKGCFDDSSTTNNPEEKKKAKPNFESQTPVTLPGYYPMDPEERRKLEEEAKNDEEKRQKLLSEQDPALRFNKTKLGHWVSVDLLAIANNFNADGYLETTAYSLGREQLIEGTDYSVQTSRPVNLVKGDWKKLESSVYLPRKDGAANSARINYVINNGNSIPAINLVQPHNILEDYQFHMVLLSNRSDSLKYLSFLDSIKLPGGSASMGEEPIFYSIVPTNAGDPIPLPGQSLNWTTIAYLIWDNLDPDDLSRAQQGALIDWLQFGGQIIFSGPDCLDRLQSSFLADYLPGQFEESITLGKSELDELNRNWSVTSLMNASEKRELIVQEKTPLTAIRFKPHVDANFIEGSSGLAIERRIGRGRVVATAFSINNPQIKSWRSFSSFFHNALLRKPDRRFAETPDLNLITFKYKSDNTSIYDPLTGSTLRYISRDLAANSTVSKTAHTEAVVPNKLSGGSLADQALYNGLGAQGARSDYMLAGTGLSRNKDDFLHYGGFQSYRQSGVAGWNDDSGVASAARETLKKAARITPPSASFVMKMLGLYLLVLVPLNWLIFRLMGKVEWAWIAAPIIALTGAFMVVKYAALDIGFVRSVTHVGLLELQGDFERGHMTDYSALYTSLSTRYNVELDNMTGQTLPFANVNPGQFREGEVRKQVELERTTTTDLRNFLVRSNSTGLLHTEMMFGVGGPISLKGDESLYEVENESLANLEDVGVLRRTDQGELQFAWIGELGAGTNSQLDFETIDRPAAGWNKAEALVGNSKVASSIWESLGFKAGQSVALEELKNAPELSDNWGQLSQILQDKLDSRASGVVSRSMLASALSEIGGSNVSLVGIFNCVASNLQLGLGEVRLIGRTSQKMGQTKYNPDATQANHNLLVVVHLRHATMPTCKRDHNAVSDFIRGESNLDREDDEPFFEDEQ